MVDTAAPDTAPALTPAEEGGKVVVSLGGERESGGSDFRVRSRGLARGNRTVVQMSSLTEGRMDMVSGE